MTTVLISGANKGIGRALVEAYLARPNTTVLVTVRDPSSAEANSLLTVPATEGSRLMILKVESTSDKDAAEAIKAAMKKGIASIDVVVANAGTFTPSAYKPVSEVSIEQVREHLDINTIGPIRLFQAAFPLLKKSPDPKFITISSIVGTIGGLKDIPYPNGAYGGSKAAANFFSRKIHFENSDISTLALHPGGVKTEAGNEAARAVGFAEAWVDVEDSIKGVMQQIDSLTKENGSGEFISFDGSTITW